MKKFKNLAIVIIVFIALTGCSHSHKWVLFESTKGFTAEYPEAPHPDSTIINSAIGELKLYTFIYDASKSLIDDNMAYAVTCMEYPDSLINSDMKEDSLSHFFRKGIDEAINNMHAKLLSETVIKLDGYPGREVRAEFLDRKAVIKMRGYLVKNMQYMIQVITDAKKDNNISIDKFMDSFKLNKKK